MPDRPTITASDQSQLAEQCPRFCLRLDPLLGPVSIAEYANMISGVVVAGQCGDDAKPMDPDWVRSLRDECAKHGIPFCLEAWGQWAPVDHKTFAFSGTTWTQINKREFIVKFQDKKEAGRTLDGTIHDAYPTGAIL